MPWPTEAGLESEGWVHPVSSVALIKRLISSILVYRRESSVSGVESGQQICVDSHVTPLPKASLGLRLSVSLAGNAAIMLQFTHTISRVLVHLYGRPRGGARLRSGACSR